MTDADRPTRASTSERAYFQRVALANARIEDALPPSSLQAALARLDALRALHRDIRVADASTRLASIGDVDLADVDLADDLAGHLAYLRRIRARSLPNAPAASTRSTDTPCRGDA